MTQAEMQRLLVEAATQGRKVGHDHCWHPWQGPIHMVLQNGHVLMKCCECEDTETRHADHVGRMVDSVTYHGARPTSDWRIWGKMPIRRISR